MSSIVVNNMAILMRRPSPTSMMEGTYHNPCNLRVNHSRVINRLECMSLDFIVNKLSRQILRVRFQLRSTKNRRL